MITLCIRYTLNANKLAEFEAYARSPAEAGRALRRQVRSVLLANQNCRADQRGFRVD